MQQKFHVQGASIFRAKCNHILCRLHPRTEECQLWSKLPGIPKVLILWKKVAPEFATIRFCPLLFVKYQSHQIAKNLNRYSGNGTNCAVKVMRTKIYVELAFIGIFPRMDQEVTSWNGQRLILWKEKLTRRRSVGESWREKY